MGEPMDVGLGVVAAMGIDGQRPIKPYVLTPRHEILDPLAHQAPSLLANDAVEPDVFLGFDSPAN